jgi:hypothetical protein
LHLFGYILEYHRRVVLNSPEDWRKMLLWNLGILSKSAWRRTSQNGKFLRNMSPPVSILCMSEKRAVLLSVCWLKKIVRRFTDSAGRVSIGGCEFETVWGHKILLCIRTYANFPRRLWLWSDFYTAQSQREISQHPLVNIVKNDGHAVKLFNVKSSRDTDTEAPVTQRGLLCCGIAFEIRMVSANILSSRCLSYDISTASSNASSQHSAI